MRAFYKTLIITAAILLASSCMKEPYYDGYWEYVNETSLDCMVRIYTDNGNDFVNLHIPAGDQRISYNEAYDGGSLVLYRYKFATIQFSDGVVVEYTKGDTRIGNPLIETNYDIQLVDDTCRLTLKITDAIHDAAANQ